MKRILISGYLGFDNFGDEALLHVLIKDLLDAGILRQNITVISKNPNATKRAHNVNSINRWNVLSIVSALLI